MTDIIVTPSTQPNLRKCISSAIKNIGARVTPTFEDGSAHFKRRNARQSKHQVV